MFFLLVRQDAKGVTKKFPWKVPKRLTCRRTGASDNTVLLCCLESALAFVPMSLCMNMDEYIVLYLKSNI